MDHKDMKAILEEADRLTQQIMNLFAEKQATDTAAMLAVAKMLVITVVFDKMCSDPHEVFAEIIKVMTATIQDVGPEALKQLLFRMKPYTAKGALGLS